MRHNIYDWTNCNINIICKEKLIRKIDVKRDGHTIADVINQARVNKHCDNRVFVNFYDSINWPKLVIASMEIYN